MTKYPPDSKVFLKNTKAFRPVLILKEHLDNGDLYCYDTDSLDTVVDHLLYNEGMSFSTVKPEDVLRVEVG